MNPSPKLPQLKSHMEVLVIEDEPRIRAMLAQALRDLGFVPTVVGAAEHADNALAKVAFDIVILDLNLPGMSGLEYLQSVRPTNPGIQAIVLTGYGDLEAAKMAIHLDVVEFLSKPCSLGELEKALERARVRRRTFLLGSPAQVSEPESGAAPAPTPAASADSGESMEDIERLHILRVLEKNSGNRAVAAAELGISLRKLYYRLGEYQKKGLL